MTELRPKRVPGVPVSKVFPNKTQLVTLLLFTLVFLLAFSALWEEVWKFVSRSDYHSHIILIPPVVVFLIYLERRKIFSEIGFSKTGLLLLVPALLLQLGWYHWGPLQRNQDTLAWKLLLAVLIWIAGFACIMGVPALKKAAFPLGFLVFFIPPPDVVEGPLITLLQTCSADLSHSLLRLSGVPIFRDEFIFILPGVALEVARVCSGIRSTMALLICSVLFGHLRLQRRSAKALLALMTFPITIFSNAVRISLLSLLSVYVDPSLLETSHHYSAGKITFGLAFVLMFLMLLGFERWERGRPPVVSHI